MKKNAEINIYKDNTPKPGPLMESKYGKCAGNVWEMDPLKKFKVSLHQWIIWENNTLRLNGVLNAECNDIHTAPSRSGRLSIPAISTHNINGDNF